MTEGWLEDRIGLLVNHYLTLSQAEVDRFQDTIRLLKDYYKGMEGKIPDELAVDYPRLPLVEVWDDLPMSISMLITVYAATTARSGGVGAILSRGRG